MKILDQKKKQDELIKEKLKKEEEFLMVEQKYNNAEEELAQLREKVKGLQNKCKIMKAELSDIDAEHE